MTIIQEKMNVRDIDLIRDVLQLAVTEVVEAMTDISIQTGNTEIETVDFEKQMVSAITFNNGMNFDGIFFLYISEELAWECTRRILSRMPNITKEDVWDAVGEILNIIVGKFKAVLTSHNYELFDFSTPIRSIDEKQYLELMSRSKIKIESEFVTDEGNFTVQIHFDN